MDGAAGGTTAGLFLQQAGRLASRPLVHYHRLGRWHDLSWIEMREHALRIASGLVAAGVEVGDRVVVLAENRVEWLACQLGLQLAGAVMVPIDPAVGAPTARSIAGTSGAVLAIVSGEALAARLHLTDTLGQIVRMDGEVARWLGTACGGRPYEEVRRRLSALGPGDGATMAFTTGAGGPPRGEVITHGRCVEVVERGVLMLGAGAADGLLLVLPFAAAHGSALVAIAAGATVWVSRGPGLVVDDIRAARPTIVLAGARVLESIRDSAVEEVCGRSSLRRTVLARAIAMGRERAAERHAGAWTWLRHLPVDRLVLASVLRRAGGGRLRLLVSDGGELRGEVGEFFQAVGVPVRQGWWCGAGAPGDRPTPAAGERAQWGDS